MNRNDAFILANRIETSIPCMRVIAVGRFLPVDQIRSDSPWKISVKAEGIDKPRVVSSDDDVRLLA